MTTPITPLPNAPQRSDPPDVFTPEAETWVDSLAQFTTEVNTVGDEMEVLAANADSSATAAAQSVTDAAAQVTLAEAQVTLATTQADRSATEADRSEAAADRAESVINYRGLYVNATGAATAGGTYEYLGALWLLLVDVPDITATVPSSSNPDWLLTSGVAGTTLTKTFSSSEQFILTVPPNTTAPIVTATREVAQTGVENNEWVTAIANSEFTLDTGLQVANDALEIDLTGGTYVGQYLTAVTTAAGQIDTNYWTDINSMSDTSTLNGQTISYLFSDDGRTTFYNMRPSLGSRNVVRDNGGTWEYNSNLDFSSETWTAATTNTLSGAIADSFTVVNPSSQIELNQSFYTGNSLNVAPQDTNPQDCFISPDGTRIYMLSGATRVYEYSLSTPNDLSTATYTGNSLSLIRSPLRGLTFNQAGTRLYYITTAGIQQHNLSTPFDLSTAGSEAGSVSLTGISNASGLFINDTGDEIWIMNRTNSNIVRCDLGTPFEVSTLTVSGTAFNPGGVVNSSSNGLCISPDGTRVLIGNETTRVISQINMATPFNFVGNTFGGSYDASGLSTSLTGVTLSNSGEDIYFVSRALTDEIFQLKSTAFLNDLSPAVLAALTDADFPAVTTTLDMAITLRTDDAGATPTTQGVTVNYDGNVAGQVAVNGTNYIAQKIADDKLRFTALTAGNYKVKVV